MVLQHSDGSTHDKGFFGYAHVQSDETMSGQILIKLQLPYGKHVITLFYSRVEQDLVGFHVVQLDSEDRDQSGYYNRYRLNLIKIWNRKSKFNTIVQ